MITLKNLAQNSISHFSPILNRPITYFTHRLLPFIIYWILPSERDKEDYFASPLQKVLHGDLNYEICVLLFTNVEHDQLYIFC